MLHKSETRPILIIHFFTLFFYALTNNILNQFIGRSIFGEVKILICWVCMACLNGKILHPEFTALSCTIYFFVRLLVIFLLSRFIVWFPKYKILLNELLYLSYEADLLCMLLMPVTYLFSNSPVSYYFGSAGAFFTLQSLAGIPPFDTFLPFVLLCVWLHWRTKFWSWQGLLLRLGLTFSSLLLYIGFFDHIYKMLWR